MLVNYHYFIGSYYKVLPIFHLVSSKEFRLTPCGKDIFFLKGWHRAVEWAWSGSLGRAWMTAVRWRTFGGRLVAFWMSDLTLEGWGLSLCHVDLIFLEMVHMVPPFFPPDSKQQELQCTWKEKGIRQILKYWFYCLQWILRTWELIYKQNKTKKVIKAS